MSKNRWLGVIGVVSCVLFSGHVSVATTITMNNVFQITFPDNWQVISWENEGRIDGNAPANAVEFGVQLITPEDKHVMEQGIGKKLEASDLKASVRDIVDYMGNTSKLLKHFQQQDVVLRNLADKGLSVGIGTGTGEATPENWTGQKFGNGNSVTLQVALFALTPSAKDLYMIVFLGKSEDMEMYAITISAIINSILPQTK